MNKNKIEYLLGSVCLERNRWGSRVPSYAVSEWLPRLTADGFDGVELWQFHYSDADDEERDKLAANGGLLPIYNTYIRFDEAVDAERTRAAEAVARLGARGVKYNVGGKCDAVNTYRENLLAWASQVPAACQLLCECHPGTVLEEPQRAAEFFNGLDRQRFGIIVHVGNTTTDGVARWFDLHGDRIKHLHVQLRDAAADPACPDGRDKLDASLSAVRKNGFVGSLTFEFTRGIGREEDMETLYANACSDMHVCREILS